MAWRSSVVRSNDSPVVPDTNTTKTPDWFNHRAYASTTSTAMLPFWSNGVNTAATRPTMGCTDNAEQQSERLMAIATAIRSSVARILYFLNAPVSYKRIPLELLLKSAILLFPPTLRLYPTAIAAAAAAARRAVMIAGSRKINFCTGRHLDPDDKTKSKSDTTIPFSLGTFTSTSPQISKLPIRNNP